MLPALLSFLALGSAAAARGAARQLMPWLFVASLALLAYGHYLVWIGRTGHQAARWILLVNTLLVSYLWYGRVRDWVERWPD